MTIPQLIAKIVPGTSKYDPRFAKRFRSLSEKCCVARDELIKAGTGNDDAAREFLESWRKILRYFADDPKSLAALSVPPTRKPVYTSCDTTLKYVTALQNTMCPHLYELQKTRKPKSYATPRATSRTSKKTRTSKVK